MTFANAYTRYQWKEARLLMLLERIPFHQCLVFLNSRSRYKGGSLLPLPRIRSETHSLTQRMATLWVRAARTCWRARSTSTAGAPMSLKV